MIAEWLSTSWTGFGAELGNHLWQSTVFVAVAALLTLALRKNHARARYWLWLAASLKFLVPFSLLIALGASLAPSRATIENDPMMYFAMEKVTQPFALPAAAALTPMAQPVAAAAPTLAQTAMHWLPAFLGLVWLCGFLAVFAAWCNRWRQVWAAKGEAAPLRAGREVEILRRLEREAGMRKPIPAFLSETSLEPGIFGIFRPVLLWPQGISARLDGAQLEAILAHELSHVRRRDNLAAAIHVLVEAIFWFYPVVWWLGGQLIEEREQACDEAVVQRGKAQQAYAEGILKVCQFCVEAPAACVSGVTGADLKQRIRLIMTQGTLRKLNIHRKLLLATAALAAILAPLAFGVIGAPQEQASADMQAIPTFGPEFKYAVASIKPDKSGSPRYRDGFIWDTPPDGLRMRNLTLRNLFSVAYLEGGPLGGVRGYREDQVFGAPAWFDSDRYDVEAKIEGPAIDELQKLDREQRSLARAQMLRELLEDRFALKVHRETREIPVYIMTVAKGGVKFKEATPGETFPNEDQIRAMLKRQGRPTDFPNGWGGVGGEPGHPGISRARFWDAPVSSIAWVFDRYLDHQVVDKTGLTGRYDFNLRWSDGTDTQAGSPAAGGAGANSGPAFDASTPADAPPLTFKAVEKELGLKLKAGKARLPVIVIDHVEKPSEN